MVKSLKRLIKSEFAKYGVDPDPIIVDNILRYLKFAGIPGLEEEMAKKKVREIVYGHRYWIFQSNPDRFRIIEWLKKYYNDLSRPDVWSVNRYSDEIKVGDTVFIWKAKGSESWRGIVAVAKVIEHPDSHIAQEILDMEKKYWTDEKYWEEAKEKPQIWIKYTKIIVDRPLKEYELITEGLGNLSILKNPRGTVFKVTNQEGKKIEKLIEKLLS